MSKLFSLGGKPSKLLLSLLGITLVAGLLLGYLLMFPTNIKTENLNITNISDSGATIVWTTDKSAKATVEVVGGNKYVDDRDTEEVDQGVYAEVKDGSKARYTHHVTLRNLEPEKDYSFEIKNNGKVSKVEATKFKTYSTVDKVSTPDPVYGRVKDVSGNLLGDTYVILKKTSESGHESEYVSAVAEKGAYSLDLANVRGKGENKLFKDQDGDFEELQIFVNLNGKVETKKVNVPLVSDQPVTDITIGSSVTGLNNTVLIDSFAADECTGPFGHDCDVPKCGKCEIKGQVSDCIGSMNCRKGVCVEGSDDPDVVCGGKGTDANPTPSDSEDGKGDDSSNPRSSDDEWTGACAGYQNHASTCQGDKKINFCNKESKTTEVKDCASCKVSSNGVDDICLEEGDTDPDDSPNDISCNVTDPNGKNYCEYGCNTTKGGCLEDNLPVVPEQTEYDQSICEGVVERRTICRDENTAVICENSKIEDIFYTTKNETCLKNEFQEKIYLDSDLCVGKETGWYCDGNFNYFCDNDVVGGNSVECADGTICMGGRCMDNSDDNPCVGLMDGVFCDPNDEMRSITCKDGNLADSFNSYGIICITAGVGEIEWEYRERIPDIAIIQPRSDEVWCAYYFQIIANKDRSTLETVSQIIGEKEDDCRNASLKDRIADRLIIDMNKNVEDVDIKFDRTEIVSGPSSQNRNNLMSSLLQKVDAQGSNIKLGEEMEAGLYEVVGSNVVTKQIELLDPTTVKVFNDLNGNGIRDLGEEYISEDEYASLNISFRKVTDSIGYKLKTGWNTIHIPMVMDTEDSSKVKKASDLIKEFNTQGAEVTHITTYRSGKFVIYSDRKDPNGANVVFGEDFTILPGEGYFVKNYIEKEVALRGRMVDGGLELVVESGWNLVGIYNSNVENYQGFKVIEQMNGAGVSAKTLSRWEDGQYTNLVVDGGTGYGNDYTVYRNNGYWIQNIGARGKYSPN